MNRHAQKVQVRESRQLMKVMEDDPSGSGLGFLNLNDAWDAITGGGNKIVDDVKDTVTSGGGKVVTDIINSSEFKQVLDAVDQKVREGIAEEISNNAIKISLLALAGGAVGGAVFKGTFGIIGAGLVAAWAANSMMSGGEKAPPPPAKTRTR